MSRNLLIHPLARPADRLLFAPTRDRYGVRLALVFGNHAPGGRCPYYAAGKCHHCDIGAGEGAAVTSELNRQRLAWFQEHYRQVLPEVVHLVLYNSGSLLNPQEMPADLLDEVLVWARSLPALRMVSLETRENAVNRTLDTPRGRCVRSRQDGACDIGPGDIRRSSARGTSREAHVAGGSEKGGRGHRFGGGRIGDGTDWIDLQYSGRRSGDHFANRGRRCLNDGAISPWKPAESPTSR